MVCDSCKPTLTEVLHRKGLLHYDEDAVDFIIKDTDEAFVIRRYKRYSNILDNDFSEFVLPGNCLKDCVYLENSTIVRMKHYDDKSRSFIYYPVADTLDTGRASIFQLANFQDCTEK